ncbi:MAG TPA: LLM class flavin-dependent oxidoreductase [Candidatus Angelobacter sp.]|nr:LLM class flavin-dependent oxidoreductase [Candidatus Angelobacter sp.]
MAGEEANKRQAMEIGIYTLGDLCPSPFTGERISARQRLAEILRTAKMADEAGLDVFGVGEHHRLDYCVSSPAVLLAAISQVTRWITLTSATTVLNTVDPVRLFEEFSTLDLLSEGRAEILAGRGAFLEPFELFGYDQSHYDQLFEENLDLLLNLTAHEKVTWEGVFRSSLNEAEISPRPYQKKLPVWVGVGSSRASAARAGRYGVNLAVAMLGGYPSDFKPLIDTYREAAKQTGHDLDALKVGVTGHAYIAKTSEQAREEYYPYHLNYWETVNAQQGGPRYVVSRKEFDQLTEPETSLFVGSSEQVVEKILRQHEMFGHQRFMAQLDIGGLPFKKVAECIERLATEVAPAVRKATR